MIFLVQSCGTHMWISFECFYFLSTWRELEAEVVLELTPEQQLNPVYHRLYTPPRAESDDELNEIGSPRKAIRSRSRSRSSSEEVSSNELDELTQNICAFRLNRKG